MADSLGFIFFSSLEGLGLYSIMLAVFRLNPVHYVQRFFPVLMVMVLQSLLLRLGHGGEFLVPVISILAFVFFLVLVMRVPLKWAFVVTLGGYVTFGVIQWLTIEIGFGSVPQAQSLTFDGYMVQTVTAAILVCISVVILKYRIGFTFEFDAMRQKYESVIVIVMIALSISGLSLVAVTVRAIPILVVSLIAFVYYSLRKEREEV